MQDQLLPNAIKSAKAQIFMSYFINAMLFIAIFDTVKA